MFSLEDILRGTGGRLLSNTADFIRLGANGAARFAACSIDSRSIRPAELFIPLKGEKADGHDFLQDALSKGAGALVSRGPGFDFAGRTVVQVEDTLQALQGLARFIRAKRDLPVIGVTGSNGKTTTKELAAAVLGERMNVLKSEGNLNNQIGLPLNLSGLASWHEAAVLEMGASAPGDIRELCDMALPTHGVITNIGQSHLEGFGSIENVLKTKLELARSARTVIYNTDDPLLSDAIMAMEGKEAVPFGMEKGARVRAKDMVLKGRGSEFLLSADGREEKVSLNIPGVFNIYNALAAAAAGVAFGIGLGDIARALSGFSGVAMRCELREMNGYLFLNDVYNANPSSMREALKELVRLKREGGRAVAVLGDMLELGGYSEEAHRSLGGWMRAELGIDLLITAGDMMGLAGREFRDAGGEAIICRDSDEAGAALFANIKKGDAALVKGSRGMRMEKVLGRGN